MFKRHAWKGVLLFLLAPYMMASRGCIFIPDHDWMNTNNLWGQYYTYPGEYPDPSCMSDPFGLWSYPNFRSQVRLWIWTVPEYVVGEQDLNQVGAFTDTQVGAYYETTQGTFPAAFRVTNAQLPSGKKFRAYAWVGDFFPDLTGCLTNLNAPCSYMKVETDPALPTNVIVTSGWYVPANPGNACWNVWRDYFITCKEVASEQPPIEECYLPTSDLDPL